MFLVAHQVVASHRFPIEALRDSARFASGSEIIYTDFALPDSVAYYTDVQIEKRSAGKLADLLCERDGVAIIKLGDWTETDCGTLGHATYGQRSDHDRWNVMVRRRSPSSKQCLDIGVGDSDGVA